MSSNVACLQNIIAHYNNIIPVAPKTTHYHTWSNTFLFITIINCRSGNIFIAVGDFYNTIIIIICTECNTAQ